MRIDRDGGDFNGGSFITSGLWGDVDQKYLDEIRYRIWVIHELCSLTIYHSKSSLQILWLFPQNIHLETKRCNEGEKFGLLLYLAG
jgi:hypothetical protein